MCLKPCLKYSAVKGSLEHSAVGTSFVCVAGTGSSSSMVIPTLPVIGVPPLVFFQTLQWLVMIISQILVIVATISTIVLAFILLPYWMLRTIPKERGRSGCRRYMKTAFLVVGKWLCVQTFPALFKMHKIRSGSGNKTRTFMVFLDRKVERSLPVVAAFCSIVYCIFYSSVIVFLRYFPVEKSEECLGKDRHGRSLFCYSNSSLPVDCANFSMTELRESHYECYAIALPGFGIAVAAALGLAKVTIVGITICVKVTEGYFKMTNDPPQILSRWFCGCRRQCANCIYVALSFLLLFILLPFLQYIILIFILVDFLIGLDLKETLYDFDYAFFPVLVFYPLWYVILYLIKDHCDKGEYTSLAADMRPPDQRDWDVESEASVTEGEHEEESNGEESGNINEEDPIEIEETLLIEPKSNIEYTEVGATQL